VVPFSIESRGDFYPVLDTIIPGRSVMGKASRGLFDWAAAPALPTNKGEGDD